jgi:hypothetical protein
VCAPPPPTPTPMRSYGHGSQVVWRKQGPPPRTLDATYIEGPRPQTPSTHKICYRSLIKMAVYREEMFVASRIEDHAVGLV